MDAKAAVRSRMREASRKRTRRIESPLVSYNDLDQPVCKVCNIPLKSETLWTGHTASRQHKAALDEFKARAASMTAKKLGASSITKVDISNEVADDAVNTPDTKRRSTAVVAADTSRVKPSSVPGARNIDQPLSDQATQDGKQNPTVQGTLPEGFFDNKVADSRARGIEPQKLDIRQEYEDFQKSIVEDVHVVDARLEEEEFEAAEEREELDLIKQRTLMDRINSFKSQQQKKLAGFAQGKSIGSNLSEIEDDELSNDSDDEDNLFVDWRAKHM